MAGLWGSPISGASMNPARTFGPDLASTTFTGYWVYIAGPIAGAARGGHRLRPTRPGRGQWSAAPRVTCSPRPTKRESPDSLGHDGLDLADIATSSGARSGTSSTREAKRVPSWNRKRMPGVGVEHQPRPGDEAGESVVVGDRVEPVVGVVGDQCGH